MSTLTLASMMRKAGVTREVKASAKQFKGVIVALAVAKYSLDQDGETTTRKVDLFTGNDRMYQDMLLDTLDNLYKDYDCNILTKAVAFILITPNGIRKDGIAYTAL